MRNELPRWVGVLALAVPLFVALSSCRSTTRPPGQPATIEPAAKASASQPDETLVKFFGITDHAGKVVFVVRQAGSMFETFAYVQAELKSSIANLKPGQRFQIVFFTDGRTPITLAIGTGSGLFLATPENKKAAGEWIDKQVAKTYGEGGQVGPSPFEVAFKIEGGPPELIFFLDNGGFPLRTTTEIAKLNPDRKTRVDTIAFQDQTAEDWLKEVARQNSGQYKFVSQETLGEDY